MKQVSLAARLMMSGFCLLFGWIVSKEELAAAVARHQLVDRPPFAGPPLSYSIQPDGAR